MRKLSSTLIGLAVLASACSGQRPTMLDSVEREPVVTSADDSAEASEVTETEADADPEPAVDGSAAIAPSPQLPAPLGDDVEVTEVKGSVKAITTSGGIVVPVVGQVERGSNQGYVVKTPCGVETVVGWGQPVGPIQVVIDPGHGGDERGAKAGDLNEADINLRISLLLSRELNDRGITNLLTRNGDYRSPVIQRTFLADHVGADILVSIHHNTPAVDPSPSPGTEMYIQHASDASRRLGGLLYEEVFAALSRYDVEWVSRTDAGVLSVLNDSGTNAYGINRRPATPSVLAELAYLGNPKEAALLETDDYADAMAVALADGIERYFTTEDAGTGFIANNRTFNPSGVTGGEDGCIDPDLD